MYVTCDWASTALPLRPCRHTIRADPCRHWSSTALPLGFNRNEKQTQKFNPQATSSQPFDYQSFINPSNFRVFGVVCLSDFVCANFALVLNKIDQYFSYLIAHALLKFREWVITHVYWNKKTSKYDSHTGFLPSTTVWQCCEKPCVWVRKITSYTPLPATAEHKSLIKSRKAVCGCIK